MSIGAKTMAQFLRHADEIGKHSSNSSDYGFSRNELLSIFSGNIDDGSDFSEVIDRSFSLGYMDARDKGSPLWNEYYVTRQGYEFLEGRASVPSNQVALATINQQTVDSADWTGARLVLTDVRVLEEVRSQACALRERIYETRFQSNSDSQDLKSLSDALVAICEMTEPDLSILDRILRHPKFKISATLIAAVAAIRGAIGI